MKPAIGVMGSSAILNPAIEKQARQIGSLIARRGAILITGATTGLPLAAAEGAKEQGGEVIGFSPAINRRQHHEFGLPLTAHDLIVYTGFSYKGRNLLNIRASDGILFLGGSMGVLNEFTIAYDEGKILGILEGSGGFCNHMKEWMKVLAKPGNAAILHYSSDPRDLVDLVFTSVANHGS
jgi:uncharacterized protein (TIGR00725 family)